MKINEKNLCAFASSSTPVDREGWLEMRGEVGKSYQRRFFMLKGNLLFYFEKKGDKEPVGVVILEGCTIELTEEESYSFKIVFHCEGGRTYYLCTNSQSSMEGWMKALACASYDYMKLMVAELQRQLDEAQAEESVEAATVVTVSQAGEEPKVPPRGQRHNPFNKAPDDSKVVTGSRHYKENMRPEVARKKVPFREIHKAHGRKILLDRSEWRASLRARLSETPLIQL
ncbi:FAM109A protein [Danaus plexippus plexippus]|uniref:FAM109A protein n=1 Tax=Danaus plexippus plexippus TaxID=278856 RepID=A0A212FFK0_DANPL|nr:FAM109A protein [Danaus plexippus plexippus]